MRYIEKNVDIRVRFSESDAMGVIWHGNYLKYFEDGREALGEYFRMNYLDIHKAGFLVPIVHIEAKYLSPITFGQNIRINCKLLETKAAKIIHEYEVLNLETGLLSCRGLTEQVFLNRENRELVLLYPEFYMKWKNEVNWLVK